MHIYIINGPNLNMLGARESEHYGTKTYKEMTSILENHCQENEIVSTIFQSNYEGEIVELIQQAAIKKIDAIVINPAAYSHYSIAILDALNIFNGFKVEVHLSDVLNRESYRKVLMTANGVDMVISNEGIDGYVRAINEIKRRIDEKED